MKTYRLFRQAIPLVALAVALIAIPSGLNAQEKSRNPQPQQSGASPAAASPDGSAEQEAFRRRYGLRNAGARPGTTATPYALEIADGKLSLAEPKDSKRSSPGDLAPVPATLGNVIDVLRDMHTDANIAMSPQLGRIQISDLKLRATSLEEELEALRVASGNRFVWMKAGMSGGGIDPTTGLPGPPTPRTGSPSLYSLTADELGAQAATKRSVEVFNLGSYLQYQKDPEVSIKQLEEIILNTLLRLKQDNWSSDEEPSYQFHSGANLLIVIGRQDALDVARRVVVALQEEAAGGNGSGFGGFGMAGGGPAFLRRYGMVPSPPPGDPYSQMTIDDLRVKLEAAQSKLKDLRTRLTDEHPQVRMELNEIDVLKKNIAERQGTPEAPAPGPQPEQSPPPARPKP